MSTITSNPTSVTNLNYLLFDIHDLKTSTKIKPYIEQNNIFNKLTDHSKFQDIYEKFIYLKELLPENLLYTNYFDFHSYLINEPQVSYLTDSDVKINKWISTISIILYNINKYVISEFKKEQNILHIASVYEDNIIKYHIFHNYEKFTRENLDTMLDIEILILSSFPSQVIDFYYLDFESFDPNNYLAQNRRVIFNRNNV